MSRLSMRCRVVAEKLSQRLSTKRNLAKSWAFCQHDWDLRRPRDLPGTAQSGLPGLKIGNLKRDAELMTRARNSAMSIFSDDPRLERPENQRFRPLIVGQQGQTFSNVS